MVWDAIVSCVELICYCGINRSATCLCFNIKYVVFSTKLYKTVGWNTYFYENKWVSQLHYVIHILGNICSVSTYTKRNVWKKSAFHCHFFLKIMWLVLTYTNRNGQKMNFLIHSAHDIMSVFSFANRNVWKDKFHLGNLLVVFSYTKGHDRQFSRG